MKIKHQFTLSIFVIGVSIIGISSIIYYNYFIRVATQGHLEVIQEDTARIATHISNMLIQKANITITLGHAPLLQNALIKSNSGFERLDAEAREKELIGLNNRWMETKDASSPFIQRYLSNSVVRFLKDQQTRFKGEYGEIFLTNKYGALVASTAKLTTLAHAHKYWWKAAYNDGKGAVFFDDRGYDDSVGGYVLGVVVPVWLGPDIVGILKCNLNVLGAVSEILLASQEQGSGKLKLTRSGGLIVYKKGRKPLSTWMTEPMRKILERQVGGAVTLNSKKPTQLVGFSPIKITTGIKGYDFGGDFESIDHKKGNKGEIWYVVKSMPMAEALIHVKETTTLLFFIGLGISLFLAIVSIFMGRKMVGPILELVDATKEIGKGRFEKRIEIVSHNEIGELAQSFNHMMIELQHTTASKEELEREITERKRVEKEREKLQEQLLQSKKAEAIGSLAGGTAHEFNNILGIIIGNTELAINDVPESNPARECLEEIQSASLRAKEVVRQLLGFARKSVFQLMPVQISPIISETLKLLRASIPTTIEIRRNISCKSDTVMADSSQINLVLLNLCANAKNAMQEEGGVLEVNLENTSLDEASATRYEGLSPGNYVKLTVKDSGHGIDSKIIDRIFDPYFTTTSLAEGTGMGLAVVHGIVKNHNGAITVASEPGQGTLFEVLFPLTEAKAEQEAGEPKALPTGNEKILFVDDEASLVKMVKRSLEMQGYQVETKSSPVETLELVRSEPDRFDLIITDMTMPKMTGDKLTKEILTIRPDMPIILCSGFSEKIDAEKAAALGIRKYIKKPMDMSDFVVSIRKVLDEARASAQQ